MAVLIAADVLIEAQRGRFDLFAWLERHPDEEFVLAAITVAELWHGVEQASPAHRQQREPFVERIVETAEVLPYTEGTAREHARLWAEVERTGFTVGAHDLILAATARETGAAIATFQPRHFKSISNLKLIEPS